MYGQRQSLNLSTQFAGRRGTIIDTMSFIDTGFRQSAQKVDIVLMNNNGIGRFFAPRESKYQAIFLGLTDIIIKEIGNPDNWIRKVMYALPYQPILSPIEADEDLHHFIGFDLLDIYWHTSALFGDVPAVKTYWEVWVKKGTDAWNESLHKKIEDIEAETYTAKLDSVGIWYIKVRGKNYKGNYGPFSAESSIVISSLLGDEMPPEVDPDFGDRSYDTGAVTLEYAIDTPTGEMAIDELGEKAVAPKDD